MICRSVWFMQKILTINTIIVQLYVNIKKIAEH